MAPSKTILLLVTDLLLQSRIREQARRLGYESVVAETLDGAREALAEDPALVFVDLQEGAIDWNRAVRAAKGRDVPVVAFGRHTRGDVLRQAREAGCEKAVPRSTLVQELPQLIEKLAGGPA